MPNKKRKKSKRRVFPSIVSEYPVRRFGVDGGFASATPYIGQLNHVEQILIENARLSNGAQSLVKKRVGLDTEIVSKIVGAYIVSRIKKLENPTPPVPPEAVSGFLLYAGNNESGYYAQMLTDTFEECGTLLQSDTMEELLSLFRLEGQTDLYERADYFFDWQVPDSLAAKNETYADKALLSRSKEKTVNLYGRNSYRYCPIAPTTDIDIHESPATNTKYQYPVLCQQETPPVFEYDGDAYYVDRRFCHSRVDNTSIYDTATILTHRGMTSSAKNSGDSCGISFGVSRIIKNRAISANHIQQYQSLSGTIVDHLYALDWNEVKCDDPWVDFSPILFKLNFGVAIYIGMATAYCIESPAGMLENIAIEPRATDPTAPPSDDIDIDVLNEDIEEKYRLGFFGENGLIAEAYLSDAAFQNAKDKYHISITNPLIDFVNGYDQTTGTYGNNNKFITYESKITKVKYRDVVSSESWLHGRILESSSYSYTDKIPESESGDASTKIVYAVIDNNMRTIEAFIQLFRMVKYMSGVREGWQNKMRAAVKVCGPDGTRDAQAENRLKNSVKNFTSSVRLLQARAGKLSKDSAEVVTGTMGIHRYVIGGDPEKSISFGKMLSEFLAETNRVRQGNGVDTVSWSYPLSVAARMHAVDCANTGIFGHYGSGNQGPLQRGAFGQYGTKAYYSYTISENISYAQNSAVDAIAAFMASTAGHRENLLHPQWKEVGLCVIPSAPGVVLSGFGIENYLIWVQVFGLQQQF